LALKTGWPASLASNDAVLSESIALVKRFNDAIKKRVAWRVKGSLLPFPENDGSGALMLSKSGIGAVRADSGSTAFNGQATFNVKLPRSV
jgi:hypothetical protein